MGDREDGSSTSQINALNSQYEIHVKDGDLSAQVTAQGEKKGEKVAIPNW